MDTEDQVDAVLGVGVFARPPADPEAQDGLLTISAFARRSRLSMKALRLYERQGLLPPAHVDRSNSYRWYRESQLVTARLVAMLRRLDMPLAHVSKIVSAPGPRRAALLASYWAEVERRIASQRELAAHLQTRLLGERSFETFEVHERDVPEQLVLTEQRHAHPEDLRPWRKATTERLARIAQAYGGVAGPTFVVIHGEVNMDSDGPVELCVPIAPALAPAADVATRREPAHREAYVRLRKAQVQYPQILSAFDAVAEWMVSRGLDGGGPPREVYFTDLAGFFSAGPSEEVCDVAFPLG